MKTRNATITCLLSRSRSLAFSGWLGALTLVSTSLVAAPTIPNPSFEADTFTVFPGYISGNSPITGWTAGDPTRAGINPGGGSPFANNGVIPNGSQVAFIQNSATASLSTVISDLTVGDTYKVNFRVNARGGNTPNLKVDIDGANVINTAVTSVGGVNPYKYFAFDFTATATSQTMALRNDAGGDNTVLLDDFTIAPRNSGWSYAAWNDDASSGVDGTKTYTHAYSFGSATPTTINGINFTGIGGGNPSVAGSFSTAGLPNVFNNDGNNVIEGSRQLANDFLYNGTVQSVTIDGLTFGKSYVATIYSVGWENGTRAATFSVGNDHLTVNQDHFGDNNGIRVSYLYTAAGSSVTLTFVPLQANTFHTYGFSNYEVPPPQIVNPSFEADSFAVFPGYVSGNGPITGWNALGGHGVNPGTTFSPFADNGTIPHGTKAAFLQADGAMSQVVNGFIVGNSYQVRFFENARNCCSGTAPFVEAKIGGVTIVAPHASPPVGGSNPYREVLSDPFVATATSLELAFIKSNPQGGDTTLLIDNVSIVPPNTPPTISAQPQDATIGLGDTATLTVVASGSAPLTYQWYFGGSAIAGATSATLDVIADFPDVAGDYFVIVANGAGSITSRTARLTVRDKVTTFFNTGVDEFGDAMPDGSPDTHYSLIVNPDSATTVPVVEDSTVFPIVAGPWVANNARSKWIGPRLETSGAAGAVGSGGDYVYRTVVDLTGFDPASVAINGVWSTDNEGLDIVVNGVSTGQRNTAQFPTFTPFSITSGLLAGLNNIDFKLNNSAVGYTGLRVDRVSALGTALPAGTAPFIVQQPQNINPSLGSRVTFSVRANGSAPLSYQWFFGNDALPGETRPELSFTLDFPDQAGDYRVEVRNAFGTVLSSTATLTVRDAPLILTQPQSQAVAVGDTVTFSVTVDGAAPFTYQWAKNGTDIAGANSSTLTLTGVALTDAGNYTVRISNFAGTATSAIATLTVLEAIPGLFNTGVDGSGVSLPSGTVDSHWTITLSADPGFPGPDALVLNDSGFPIPPWLANDEFSKWIAPRADQSTGNLEGDYSYRTTFSVSGFDPATVRVAGEWATDNAGTDIVINGISTGQRNDGQFVVWTPFQVNSGFVAGANTLDFKVNNAPTAVNPTGFRVRNIRALGARLAIQPPTVTITSPTNGATIEACTTATICAEASAVGGASIAQVVFIAAGIGPIGVATTAPYCVNVPNAPAGAYVLTAIALDSNGNSATSAPVNVTVADTTPPTITCPANITVTATELRGATVSYAAPTASDACGVLRPSCTPPSGSLFIIGATTVNCTITDGVGLTATCSFQVTVIPIDTDRPPTAIINSEQLINLQPEFEHPVLLSCNWWNACLVADGWTSSDPEGGDLTYVWFLEPDPVPFGVGPVVTNCLEVGTHTIVLVVTDPTGLSDTDSKTIEVVTAPLAIDLLIEQINEAHKSGIVLTRKIKRELTETLRIALGHAGQERLRETQKTLDAFEKKVRAQVVPVNPEAARVWILWSQAVSEGMEKCIKPPRKRKHDDSKDPKDPPPPKGVTICYRGSTIEVSQADLQGYLDQGATLGPCSAQTVTICFQGTTIEVPVGDLQLYLNQGATLGSCEN